MPTMRMAIDGILDMDVVVGGCCAKIRRMLKPALLQGIPAPHDPHNDRDESEEKQNVEVAAQSVGGDNSG